MTTCCMWQSVVFGHVCIVFGHVCVEQTNAVCGGQWRVGCHQVYIKIFTMHTTDKI